MTFIIRVISPYSIFKDQWIKAQWLDPWIKAQWLDPFGCITSLLSVAATFDDINTVYNACAYYNKYSFRLSYTVEELVEGPKL